MDVKHCDGCRDDFYNGHNELGVKVCWMRAKATLEDCKLIPIDLEPPYTRIPITKRPTCYRKRCYSRVKPEALDSNGFWKGF